MNLQINFIDNNIVFEDGKVNVIEIENKEYFYRIVSELNNLQNGIDSNEITYFVSEEEKQLLNKLNVYIDYFNIDLNTRKNKITLNKYIVNILDEEDINYINNIDRKLKNCFKRIIQEIDIPINIDNDFLVDNYIKLVNPTINQKDQLLDKLTLIIDFEKVFHSNEINIFINLKQYLSEIELEELYKYSIYNNVKILLIDNTSYGISNKYEKKLLIDSNLEEFLL